MACTQCSCCCDCDPGDPECEFQNAPAEFEPGDTVFIHETVTGKRFGERASVVECDGEKIIVRTPDGALFSGTKENVRFA